MTHDSPAGVNGEHGPPIEQVLSLSSVAVAAQDRDLKYLWVHNPLKQFGREPEDFIGWTDAELYPGAGVAATGVGELSEMKRRVLESGVGETRLIWFGERLGSDLYLEVIAEPLFDQEGEPAGVTSVVVDVSSYRQNEITLRRQRDELDSLNQELESFAYSVSHDLRAPLRSIDGFSQALADDHAGDLDDEALDYLRRIRSNASRMAGQIDDLLRLSRVTRAGVHSGPVDIGEIAREAFVSRHGEELGVDLLVEGPLPAVGDRDLLGLAMDNLIGNSIKFTRDAEHPEITVGHLPETDPTVFTVSDNGAGFDMEFSSRLFGAFQRLHSQTDFPGSGIGLATVRRVISKHGGRVWAEGKVGRGARISFTLERAAADV